VGWGVFDIFPFCGATAQIGAKPPRFWGFQITHTHISPVGFLWTSDQLVTETYLHHTQQIQLKNIHAFSEIRTRNPSHRTVFQRTPTERGIQHFTPLYDRVAVQFPLKLEMWIYCELKESLRALNRIYHI